jgi:hypothetical protein
MTYMGVAADGNTIYSHATAGAAPLVKELTDDIKPKDWRNYLS